jgi:urease accessory protein
MGHPLPPRPLPVVLGQAARPLGLPPEMVISLYLQSFAGNLCTIGVRHIPLGQTEGQALLATLAPLITALADRAARATLEDLGAATLAADLAAMTHETQSVRIFRT